MTTRDLGIICSALLLALTAAALLPTTTSAQGRGSGVGVGIGFSGVGSRSGSAEAAIHVQVALAAAMGGRRAAALVFDSYLMPTTVEEPLCAPPATNCASQTIHPGAVLGLSLEMLTYPWEHGLSLVTGIGGYWGPNIKGASVSRASAAVTLGATYEFREAWWPPSIAVRFTHLATDIAGVRWMMSPSIGFRF